MWKKFTASVYARADQLLPQQQSQITELKTRYSFRHDGCRSIPVD